MKCLRCLELSGLDGLMLDSYLMYLESLDVQVDRVDDEIAWRVSVGGM